MKKSLLILLVSGLMAFGLSEGVFLPVAAAPFDQGQPILQSHEDRGDLPGFNLGAPKSAMAHFLKAGTNITLIAPAETVLGEPFTLSGTISDLNGTPVVDKTIVFTINGGYLGQIRSNEKGFFQGTFKKSLEVGIYAITASFNGTSELGIASAGTILKILPADVQVQTVPPIAGITFQLDGKQFVSGEDGSADIKVSKPGEYRLEILIGLYHDPSQLVQFGRWLEDSYQPYLDIDVPTDKVIQAGLNVFNLVSQSFVDLDGLPVDPQRITEFTIRSVQGDVFVLNNGESRWFPSSRIARRIGGLEETKLLYSVISVKLDGSNVVNQSQQQFYAQSNDNWKISLLLYSLRISVIDGLFGSAAGKSVNLTYPDGRVKNYPLNRAGMAEIHSLARGNYSIQLVGANGLGNKMPVALSRNQEATMKVLTYTDLAIVGVFGGIIALALLLYGRRGSLFSSLRNHQLAFRRESNNALVKTDGIKPAAGEGIRPKDELIKWS